MHGLAEHLLYMWIIYDAHYYIKNDKTKHNKSVTLSFMFLMNPLPKGKRFVDFFGIFWDDPFHFVFGFKKNCESKCQCSMFIWCCQCFHQGGDCEIMCDEKLVFIEIGIAK